MVSIRRSMQRRLFFPSCIFLIRVLEITERGISVERASAAAPLPGRLTTCTCRYLQAPPF